MNIILIIIIICLCWLIYRQQRVEHFAGMTLDNFPLVLWINLDRSTDRREYMEQLLSGFRHHRISAIDGKNLDAMCIGNTELTAAENATTCSHLKALKYFLSTTESRVVIFEDDVSFEFLPFVPYTWYQFESSLPPYDIVQLAIIHDKPVGNQLVRTDVTDKYYSAAAYLVSRSGAAKLLRRFESDNAFDLTKKKYVKADEMIADVLTYSIPLFTYRNDLESTIHQENMPVHIKSKAQQFEMWRSSK